MQERKRFEKASWHLFLVRIRERLRCEEVQGMWHGARFGSRKDGEMTKVEEPVVSIEYGAEGAIDKDVDLFEAFYMERFKDDALGRFVKRSKKSSFRCAVAAFVFACFFPIPMIVDSGPVFAKLLLFMGLVPFGVGVYFLLKCRNAQFRCEKDLEELVASEFYVSRTVTKRVFKAAFGAHDVKVFFGVKSGVHQKRSKAYADISRVVVTDELIFIEGLTWMCKFQMGDGVFDAVVHLLERKCPKAFVDERASLASTESLVLVGAGC